MNKLDLEKLIKGASFLYKVFPRPSNDYIFLSIKDIYTVSPVPWQVKGFVEGAKACELHGLSLNPFEDGTFEVELVRLKPQYSALIGISFEKDIRLIHYVLLEVKKNTSGKYVFYRTVYFDTLQKYTKYSVEDFTKLINIITSNPLTNKSKRMLYELKVIPTVVMTTIHSLLNFPSPDVEVIKDSKLSQDVIEAVEKASNMLKEVGKDPVEILSNFWIGNYFL